MTYQRKEDLEVVVEPEPERELVPASPPPPSEPQPVEPLPA